MADIELEQSDFPGPSGINYVGVWNPNYPYLYRDSVYYEGSTFFARSPNTNHRPVLDDTTGPWATLAKRGENGVDPETLILDGGLF